MSPRATIAKRPAGKHKLLEAALRIIRTKGYAAATVDDLCAAAGVTKGAFFHHFASKDALAVAAAEFWSEKTGALFAKAPYHKHPDPLQRILSYIDFRRALLRGKVPEFTCLVGTMVQETYASHPAIRAACDASIRGHAATLEADIEAAIAQHGKPLPVTAQSLALHTQTVIQGAFVLAKAADSADVAAEALVHLRRYIELLFELPEE